jgi:hypothetical protein
LNGSTTNKLGFYQQFSANYESQAHSPSKNKNNKHRKMLNFNDSPMTKKQLQLEEFSINLKENKITKYGIPNNESDQKGAILNKNLRKRIENSKPKDIKVTTQSIGENADIFENSRFKTFKLNSNKKMVKRSNEQSDYTPSAFINGSR